MKSDNSLWLKKAVKKDILQSQRFENSQNFSKREGLTHADQEGAITCMQLSLLKKDELLDETESLVKKERKITLQLIEALREIERRMLYLDLGYSSLFEFCVKRLGLSEGAAQRRISAMRLARDLPEVKESLESGRLSLSNAAKLHSVFNQAKKQERKIKERVDLGFSHGKDSQAEMNHGAIVGLSLPARELVNREKPQREVFQKKDILNQVLGLTQRECEARLLSLLPQAAQATQKEKIRKISSNSVELKLILDERLQEKLNRLKELLSHQIPDGSMLDLLEYLADQELKRLEKKCGISLQKEQAGKQELLQEIQITSEVNSTALPVRFESPRSGIQVRAQGNASIDSQLNKESNESSGLEASIEGSGMKVSKPQKRAYIPAALKREVWKRAAGKCEYAGCTSRYQLELDHCVPVSLGGEVSLRNLRLVCRRHNVHQARKWLGDGVMRKYVPSLR